MCVTYRTKWIKRRRYDFLMVSFPIQQLNAGDSRDLEECRATGRKEPESLSEHRWKGASLEAPVLDMKRERVIVLSH